MEEKRIPDEMLMKVEPEWQEEIVKFVNTGVAKKEFQDHFDHCGHCIALVDYVFKHDCKAFEEVCKRIQKEREEAKRKREEELKKYGFLKRLWMRFVYWIRQP